MANTPTILIEQVGRPAGTAGVSRDDLVTGSVVTLSDPANPGAGTHGWELVPPVGSAAALSSSSAASPTYIPDIAGTYLHYKTFTDVGGTKKSFIGTWSNQGGAGVRLPNGTRVIGTDETKQFGGWQVEMDSILRALDDLIGGGGGGGGNVVDTLQQTYDIAAATITKAAAKPIAITDAQTDGSHAFTISKTPGSAAGGNAIDVALNANASGAGVKITHDGLAVESVHGLGLWLLNSTAAANGAQQVSPDFKLTAHAWKSDATAASQQHDWVLRVFPTQGTSVSTSALSIRHRIDAAAFGTVAQITSSGQLLGTQGTAALPTHGSTGAAGLGIFFPTSTTIGLAISAAEVLRVAAAQMQAPDGSAGAPYYSFSGATAMGAYRSTNTYGLRGIGQIDLNINGTVVAAVGSTAFFPATTAVTSLGQSGLRWTFIYGQSADLAQAVSAGATASPALKVTGAAHTTQTAGAEILDVDLALNRTVQHATGAVATQRAVLVRAPTYSFAGASVITDAVTMEISGAPAAGSNCTITNNWALRVVAGDTRLGGALSVGGNGTFGGQMLATTGGSSATPTYASVGDPDTGLHFPGGNVLTFGVGGADAAYVKSDGFVALNGLRFNDGETTTKIYREAANSIAIDVSGAEFFRIRADGARFSRSVRTVPVVLTDAATVTPDLALSNQFTHTAAGSRPYANPSNIVAGMQWQVDFTQDGTGGRTITWGSSYVGPNGAAASTVQPESGANRVTVLTFKAITTTKIAIIKSDWY